MHHDAAVERFYTSRAWKISRRTKLSEAGGLCEICYSRGLIVPAVHVHHKVHLTAVNVNDPAIALNTDNLMALCESCHAEQHRTVRWRCDAAGHVTL